MLWSLRILPAERLAAYASFLYRANSANVAIVRFLRVSVSYYIGIEIALIEGRASREREHSRNSLAIFFEHLWDLPGRDGMVECPDAEPKLVRDPKHSLKVLRLIAMVVHRHLAP